MGCSNLSENICNMGDHPCTDTICLIIEWKCKPSQPKGDDPLWPYPLLVSNFVRHSCMYAQMYIHNIYIYILCTHILTGTYTGTCFVGNHWLVVRRCQVNDVEQGLMKPGMTLGRLRYDATVEKSAVNVVLPATNGDMHL